MMFCYKAPVIPKCGKGTECIKLLLIQVSKDMFEVLIQMFFLYLAHNMRCKISVSLHRLEGTMWHLGLFSCRKWGHKAQKLLSDLPKTFKCFNENTQ